MRKNMNYDTFVSVFFEEINNYLPEELFGTKRVRFQANAKGESFTIENPVKLASPVIYLNELYQNYLEKGQDDFDQFMIDTTRMIANACENAPMVDLSKETVTKKVYFQLVNAAANEELLSNAPHRMFLDLAIIYRLLVEKNEQHVQSSVITKELASTLNLDEESLYQLALANTRELFPSDVVRMEDMMKRIYEEEMGIPAPANFLQPLAVPMWIITNTSRMFGAGMMLYQDLLDSLACKENSDLYVIPSSVHEVIVVGISNMDDTEEMNNIIRTVNSEQVLPEEQLSDHAYRYDHKSHSFTIV